MTIAFFSNFMNHHQIGVADELYKLTSGHYYFIETQKISDTMIQNGYPVLERDYILRPYSDNNHASIAKELARNADVVIFGGNEELQEYRFARLKDNKLTFEYSERWLKKGLVNLLSPRLLYFVLTYHMFFRKKSNYYALCSSAYAALDYNMLGTFRGKCFKWGYFTKILDNTKSDLAGLVQKDGITNMMWCARFIDWKHPEVPIYLAQYLKNKGYSFKIDMFGSGELDNKTKQLAKELNVEDVISFRGNLPNAQILNEMKKHELYIFTSDRNEGWGAVANEALSCGCLLIANRAIGSVPYLIEDGESGFVYNSMNDLFCKVEYAICNPLIRVKIAKKGYENIIRNWSPFTAASNLYYLSKSLLESEERNVIKQGPCSLA